MKKRILLASPRGFCAGVVRAIDIVNLALEVYGTPLYVLNEIVHNAHVVNSLRKKGVQFVRTLDDVPSENRVIFSAHGISPEVRKRAAERNLKTLDATGHESPFGSDPLPKTKLRNYSDRTSRP
jgi:4-hydroxy-3-methylbut-2-en-1-yl diphosphate reductase